MRVGLFGATGMIGSRILHELLSRGHLVTAVVREVSKLPAEKGLTAREGDVFDPASVAEAVHGADAAISAYAPGTGTPEKLVPATKSLLEGLNKGGLRRFLMVGGAGSLEVAPGVTLLNSPNLPEAWRPIAQAHSDALDLLKASDLDWTSLSPAALIEPGERTGHFRLGHDQLIADAQGNSKISAEDFSIAMVDELEKGAHVRQRFTLGY